MSEDAAFETEATRTLRAMAERIEDRLSDALEVELQGGILTIELEDGRQFVVNKHSPTRQIWLSSPFSGATHFARDATGAWRSTRGEETLTMLLQAELSRACGVDFSLER